MARINTPSVGHRIHALQQRLVNMRVGPGALALPKDISRIHLRFGQKVEGGHQGPRNFWRRELIQLKYHNPAVSMTVDNKAPQTDRAIMSIHYVPKGSTLSSDSATAAPAPVGSTSSTSSATADAPATTNVETIDMTNITQSEILDKFIQLTQAKAIPTSQEDKELLEKLKEEDVKSERDRKQVAEYRAQVAREKSILEQAKGLVS